MEPYMTDEKLRAAYEYRRRHDWPATFEAAMSNPFYERLIKLQARHNNIREHRAQTGYLRIKRRQLPLVAVDGELSQKSRASGEKPDLD